MLTTPSEVVVAIARPSGAMVGVMKLLDETLNRDPGMEHEISKLDEIPGNDDRMFPLIFEDGGVNVNGSPRESP